VSEVIAPLTGQRVLIVEDRYLIASEVAEQVGRLGGEVVGPSRDVASAAELVAEGPLDMAVLDISLEGEVVFPLAEALAARGVPFVFLTGYDVGRLPSPWRERPALAKPINPTQLRDELLKLRRAPQ
jgi:DNA-binding response OmpR family regulator